VPSRSLLLPVSLIISMLLLACGGPDPEEQAAKREWGHHCLSAWDGNHDGFETQIRDLLNDPDSMETHKTTTTRLIPGAGTHKISMEYSARNAFGGRIRLEAIGYLDPDTCEVMVVDYGFN